MEKLLGRKRIGTVPIGNKAEVLGKLFKKTKSHSHGKNTGIDATVIRYLIAQYRAAGSIHDEPDIGFEPSNLDIGYVSVRVQPG